MLRNMMPFVKWTVYEHGRCFKSSQKCLDISTEQGIGPSHEILSNIDIKQVFLLFNQISYIHNILSCSAMSCTYLE